MRDIKEDVIDSDYIQMKMIQRDIEKKQANTEKKSEPVIICL